MALSRGVTVGLDGFNSYLPAVAVAVGVLHSLRWQPFLADGYAYIPGSTAKDFGGLAWGHGFSFQS
jgi:hypothetical protein